MPSLDSKVGDLAYCYGRFDEIDGKRNYEIQLSASENPQ